MRFHPPHSMIEMAVILGDYTEIPKRTSPYPSQPYTKNESQPVARWFSKLLWHATLRHWTWTFLSDGSCLTSRPSEGTGNDGFRSTGTTWKIVRGEVVGSPKWRGEESWLGVGWMLSFSVGVDVYFWISYAHKFYTSEFKTPWKKMVGRKTILSFWGPVFLQGLHSLKPT